MGGKGFQMGGGKTVWPGFSEVTQRRVIKVGRNEPCPCGSGKKYKDCHEAKGPEYLDKLMQRREEKKLKEAGVPWYKRLLGLS